VDNNKEEKQILMEMKAIYFWLQHCEENIKINFEKNIRKFSAIFFCQIKKNILMLALINIRE